MPNRHQRLRPVPYRCTRDEYRRMEKRGHSTLKRLSRMSPLYFLQYLAQHMPGSTIEDPAVVVSQQEEDAADFGIAIKQFRTFLIEKLKLSPEEVYVAR